MADLDVKIIVAAHRDYWMPQDSIYLPMQVGSMGRPSIRENWQRDDAGDNISIKNPGYCELTGLYWAWKHLNAEYIGLMHYRRYFAGGWAWNKKKRIATRRRIERKLRHVNVILPRKRRYFIETNYSHYIHAHHEIDLVKTKEIIAERYPEYLPAWEAVMKRTKGHRFNMLVMKKELFRQYCEWLFIILFLLEERLDTSMYTGLSARVYGLVSERLLDVWIAHNHVSYVELPVVHLENQHWPNKIWHFLNRKFSKGAVDSINQRHPDGKESV